MRVKIHFVYGVLWQEKFKDSLINNGINVTSDYLKSIGFTVLSEEQDKFSAYLGVPLVEVECNGGIALSDLLETERPAFKHYNEVENKINNVPECLKILVEDVRTLILFTCL